MSESRSDADVIREVLTTLCDAVDFPGAAVDTGEMPPDWHPCRDSHSFAVVALASLEARAAAPPNTWPPNTWPPAQRVATWFHEEYERRAAEFGADVRRWEKEPTQVRDVLTMTAAAVLRRLQEHFAAITEPPPYPVPMNGDEAS